MDSFPLSDEYDRVCELGRGTYGIVSLWKRKGHLAATEKRPKYVAIKSILHSDSDWFKKTRTREIYILEKVQSGCHNNIIKYHGSFSDNSVTTQQTALVMEACHADLRVLIASKRILNDEELRFLGEQILCGLHYLHGLDRTSMILHRDLKPENILMCAYDKADFEKSIDWATMDIDKIILKISDYGMGRSLNIDNPSQISQTKGLGTYGYTAPEMEQGLYDGRADIWSSGIILHELAAKEKPKDSQVSSKISNPDLRDMLLKCFTRARAMRPSGKELLLHRFFTGTSDVYHGNLIDLIRVKKPYNIKEIKHIFMKLFALLPVISSIRSVTPEQILVRLNGYDEAMCSIDWESVNLHDITLMFAPRHNKDVSMDMGMHLKRGVKFLGKIVYQIASKEYKLDIGANDVLMNIHDFPLISFILRLLQFEEHGELQADILMLHPFITCDTESAFKFNEPICHVHMTDTDIIFGHRNGSIYVLDISTLNKRQMIPKEKCHTEVMCIDSLGQLFAVSGKEGNISLWISDSQTNQCRQFKVISCHNERVTFIRINKAFLVSYTWDCRILIHRWDVDIGHIDSKNESLQTESSLREKNEGKHSVVVNHAEIKTKHIVNQYLLVLQDNDRLIFGDGNFLGHYKLDQRSVDQPHMLVHILKFTERLRCLIPSNGKDSESSINNETRQGTENGSYRYFWIGTNEPGKIIKVDIETQTVLSVINVYEKCYIKQLCVIGRYLLCKVQEPKTTYASCLCYDTDDLSFKAHSASPTLSEIPFRQFINFGEISSELCVKGDNHVFYCKGGDFRHLSLREIVAMPKQTTLRLHQQFDFS